MRRILDTVGIGRLTYLDRFDEALMTFGLAERGTIVLVDLEVISLFLFLDETVDLRKSTGLVFC